MRRAVVCGRRLDHPAVDRAEPRYPIPRCHDARDCDLASCGAHLRRWADHVARQRLDARLAELDDTHADDLAAAIAYLENPRDNDAALRLIRRGVYRWYADGSPAMTCADRAGVDLRRPAGTRVGGVGLSSARPGEGREPAPTRAGSVRSDRHPAGRGAMRCGATGRASSAWSSAGVGGVARVTVREITPTPRNSLLSLGSWCRVSVVSVFLHYLKRAPGGGVEVERVQERAKQPTPPTPATPRVSWCGIGG